MTAEQHGNDVELQLLAPQSVASIRATIRVAELGAALDDRLSALWGYLQGCGAAPAGPPFVRYHTFGETETDLEFAIPVGEPLAGEGRTAGGARPGGRVPPTWHVGSHDTLGDAYARLDAWLQEHGREPAGAPWEVYAWLDPGRYRGPATVPDPASWRTQLIRPIA